MTTAPSKDTTDPAVCCAPLSEAPLAETDAPLPPPHPLPATPTPSRVRLAA